MHRIYHDFNKTYSGRSSGMSVAPLVCMGTKIDLDALGLSLQGGTEVILYQPDSALDGTPDCLEVKATIRYDSAQKCFVGDFVGDELMYQSEAEMKDMER